MRLIKKILVVFIIVASIGAGFYYLWLSPRYTVPILMYHRFGYGEGSLFVTPENLERQMKFLRDKGYDIIPLDELVRGIRAGRRFKHNTVVITVDDGLADNYRYGYPVFKKYNVPVTIFLIAGYIGRKDDFMTWDEVRRMQRHNISFGAHTMNHAYLPSMEDEAALWNEIKGCKDFMESKLDREVKYFCYPLGGFSGHVKGLVEKAGYNGACTTNRGFAEFNRDVYELKRVKVTNSDMNKPFSFRAKLSGYYNLFRSRKNGY